MRDRVRKHVESKEQRSAGLIRHPTFDSKAKGILSPTRRAQGQLQCRSYRKATRLLVWGGLRLRLVDRRSLPRRGRPGVLPRR